MECFKNTKESADPLKSPVDGLRSSRHTEVVVEEWTILYNLNLKNFLVLFL